MSERVLPTAFDDIERALTALFRGARASQLYQVLYFFSVPLHFSKDFSRGLVDSRHLVLYASVALFCLFLTVRSLESRRWR